MTAEMHNVWHVLVEGLQQVIRTNCPFSDEFQRIPVSGPQDLCFDFAYLFVQC